MKDYREYDSLEDFREEIAAFREKRASEFGGE